MKFRETLQTRFEPLRSYAPMIAVSAGPLFLALFVLLGPFLVSPLYTSSGLGVGVGRGVLQGASTIDPNIAITSFALGKRAALDILSGQLPLWNHYQGFGAPLLGEMQAAALFPPTLLLLLPSGQALEHIFLQWIAGVGAYLFFRRFGLGTTAAVVGAVLYEFNGVFGSLRNAAFNPVAFLPWLMYGVEVARTHAIEHRRAPERLTTVAMIAFTGALALYSGFPETAYLYGLLVMLWSLFRMTGLPLREAATLFFDLAAAALLALLLAAPLLVAFAAYLAEGDVGGHGGSFLGSWQAKETAILYLTPYIYGLFFASSDPQLSGLSVSAGGYIAAAPVALAFAALFTLRWRAVKSLLAAWILVAVGVSHGWPVIYAAFHTLPLMELAIAGRYLNASWIFCVIFLAALLLDQLPQLGARERQRAAIAALLGFALVLAAAAKPAWEVLPAARLQTVPFAGSLALALLAVTVSIIALLARPGLLRMFALAAVVAEACVLFVLPFLTYPRAGDIDNEAVAFLAAHTDTQRVAKTDGAGLAANFGSAFGIPLIHFDDLPSPKRSIEYIKTHIDAYAGHIFLPEHPALGERELAERLKLFRERLPAYANAGVKYVMAAQNFGAAPAMSVHLRDERPILLKEGAPLLIEARLETETAVTLEAISVRVGTIGNTTRGSLAVRICAAEICGTGTGDLTRVNDGHHLLIRLDTHITLSGGAPYSIAFEKNGATNAAIWTYPLKEGAPVPVFKQSPTLVRDHVGIDLGFLPVGSRKPVHVSRAMAIYELEDVRAYAAAPGCGIKTESHDVFLATCSAPAQLTRLNVHMRGWRARIDGREVPISLAEDTFQIIDLPQGVSRITFTYAPPGFGWALIAAAAAGIVIVSGFALGLRGMRRQNSADAGAPLA